MAKQVGEGGALGTLPTHGDEDAFVQVITQDGTIMAASQNLEDVGPIADFRPTRPGAEVRTDFIPVPDELQDEFRIVAIAADGPSTGPATVYVAANLDRVKETSSAVRRLLVYGLPILLVVVGALSWFLVGLALRPVEVMRSEVASIGARDLGRRVPEPRVDDEIGRLATTMNGMLDRLQASAERQRRFVADASHELQSPLASSLAELEVALAHPENAPWEETAKELVADNERMTRLVADLLYLAKADDNTAPPRQALVDLDEVVRTEVARLHAPADVAVDTSRVEPMEVRGDPDQLARVVRNLLDNASRYARSSITIELGPSAERGDVQLVVSDDGPGVPPGSQELVFERFARIDHSRHRGTGGTGLGLSIARDIAGSHGGTIELEPTPVGARFVVHLPTAG